MMGDGEATAPRAERGPQAGISLKPGASFDVLNMGEKMDDIWK